MREKRNITIALYKEQKKEIDQLKKELKKKNVTQVIMFLVDFYRQYNDLIKQIESQEKTLEERIEELNEKYEELNRSTVKKQELEVLNEKIESLSDLIGQVSSKVDLLNKIAEKQDNSLSAEAFELLQKQVTMNMENISKLLSSVLHEREMAIEESKQIKGLVTARDKLRKS